MDSARVCLHFVFLNLLPVIFFLEKSAVSFLIVLLLSRMKKEVSYIIIIKLGACMRSRSFFTHFSLLA